MENQYRVSAASHTALVAGAIAKSFRDGNSVRLRAIGAGAVNQTVKAIIAARWYLVADNIDIVFVSLFEDLIIDGAEKTAITFYVQRPGEPFPPSPVLSPVSHYQ